MSEFIKLKYEKLYADLSDIKSDFNNIYDNFDDLLLIIKSGLSFDDEIHDKELFDLSKKTLIKIGENIDDLILMFKDNI